MTEITLSNQNSTVEYQRTTFLGFLILGFFAMIAENAVTDSFLGAAAKQLSLLLLCMLSLIYVRRKIRNNEKIFLGVAFLCLSLACISLLFRSLYFYDLTMYSVARDLYHIFSCAAVLLLILSSNLVLHDRSKGHVWFVYLLALSLAPLSFLLYFLSPSTTLSYYDNQGHFLQLTYYSLSSSLYRLESIQFARMSWLFDEPGTFGLFCSLLSSFLYLRQGRLTRSGAFVLVAGLSSVSLAYNLYVIAFLVTVVLLPEWNKNNAKKAIISSGMAVLVLIAIALPIELTNDEFGKYVVSRIESVFSGNNNRSDGNAHAINLLLAQPLGASESEFGARVISSSGILVVAAYKGLLYAGAFLLLYGYFLYALLKKLSTNIRIAIPLVIALIFAILNRNNFFNVSGPIMLLVCNYISIYFEPNRRILNESHIG